jgi:hypothetical protein
VVPEVLTVCMATGSCWRRPLRTNQPRSRTFGAGRHRSGASKSPV